MRLRQLLASLVTLLALLILPAIAVAAEDLAALVDQLPKGQFKDREAVIVSLAATGDPAVVPVLQALSDGNLYARKADQKVFIGKPSGDVLILLNPLTQAEEGQAAKTDLEKIKVNNALREKISNALGGLTLFSSDPKVRRDAALTILKSGDPSALPALTKAIERESDPAIAELMRDAAAAATLGSALPDADKLAAIERLSKHGDQDTVALLSNFASTAPEPLKSAALAAVASIEKSLAVFAVIQNVWYGLSLGSVLLLAAIGLAVTFGVMGVINMAHGEMVMLGAYTTYVIQDICRTSFPGLMDWSLLMALPMAFLISGGVGVAIERGIIRFLYGRPLETLLATWGISLILQQAVRTIFGPTNQEVSTPSWMSGSIEIVDGLSLTLNRLVILLFSLAVFAGLMLLMRKSPIGLQMRAVTQNRQMANAMGIRSNMVDALTFGLGSGIAGLAGVALSQIDNVSPNLGRGYIIDSFLVVVFGGVGNLWGTLAGAMTLGVANKFLEPVAGAVLGKIIILICVILFIQKRPRGLFALKGRWVDA
ncbi:urea ABC transporter permease subunit UrtB [Aestuariivirga sp.]|uniref:urea ABC transporter permease subunit UrtB n=1 Tax=Aestuariivirga sp. TaxID=2650926 RepID=UPI0039E6B350